MASGMLVALALLWVVMRPDPDTVLCYEEPENALHPYLLRQVYGLLGKAARGEFGAPPVQVLVATHSVDFLNLCKPEEVRICERGPDGTATARSIADGKELREVIDAYRGALGELWFSGSLGGVPTQRDDERAASESPGPR
jgi:predicted ATPase